MKAMMLTGIKQMKMMEVPDPFIEKDTDVLIKMSVTGICGSDIHCYVYGKIGDQVVKYPFIVGHEGAGVVQKAGSAVTRVKPGNRIAIDPAISCFDCDQCKTGRHHTCRNLRFLGCPDQAKGCLSEYIIMPETSCFPINDSMTMDQAAISEPLAIGVYAVKQSILTGEAKIGILGFGPIGMSVMLAAFAQGSQKIYVTDKINERLALAKKSGAFWVGNPDNEDIVKSICGSEPLQLDFVFECCGQQDAIDNAIDILKPGGKLMIIGIPEKDRLSFSINKMRYKEITIINTRRQVNCVQPSLNMMEKGIIDIKNMLTHRFSFEDTQKAFELVSEYKDGVMKVMIDF